MELNFSDDFFKDEEREGFLVSEMMKRAWAAQLRVLSDIDEACKNHGISWFADYGTLLGAVRHKGFVPWDDDLDISMLRADYNVFIRSAYKDLPDGYVMFNIHNDSTSKDYLTRVVNHPKVDRSSEAMERFFGFPYSCGIDITPVDYIPRDPKSYEMYKALIEMTSVGANVYELGEEDRDALRKMLSDIEKYTKTKIDRGRNIPQQLREICEKICGMFSEAEADDFGMAIRQKLATPLRQPIASVVPFAELPFENITMPVPNDYDTWLKQRYGANYMTPVRYENRDYPFYKWQENE